MPSSKPMVVYMADDDEDDYILTRYALASSRYPIDLHWAQDGQVLLSFLEEASQHDRPWPHLVLLDLNMPRMDGREALTAIKADQRFKKIPVIVLTTSPAEEDILRSHEIGCNSYIQKPVDAEAFVRVAQALTTYWFDTVSLPPEEGE